jgi:hypothetical protein
LLGLDCNLAISNCNHSARPSRDRQGAVAAIGDDAPVWFRLCQAGKMTRQNRTGLVQLNSVTKLSQPELTQLNSVSLNLHNLPIVERLQSALTQFWASRRALGRLVIRALLKRMQCPVPFPREIAPARFRRSAVSSATGTPANGIMIVAEARSAA